MCADCHTCSPNHRLRLLSMVPIAIMLQELQRELDSKTAAAVAADAELARLRARVDEADAAEAASAAVARDNAALRRQLDEVMLSHEAAVQSKDRALAQVLAPWYMATVVQAHRQMSPSADIILTPAQPSAEVLCIHADRIVWCGV